MNEPGRTVKNFFFNNENELRCWWRVLAFILILQIAFWIIGGLVGVFAVLIPEFRTFLTSGLDPQNNGWSSHLAQGLTVLVSLSAVLLANGISARYLEHRTFASTGFQFHKGWWRDFLRGSLLGAVILIAAIGIAMALGATRLPINTTDPAFLLQSFAFFLIFFLIAAANEEAMVRGFAFQALEHNLGAVVAITLTSIIFGLLHLANDKVTLFSTLNTMIAGVWLGVAYLKTRSLWLATALHYSWNFVMAMIFGLPVSGITKFQNYAWLRGESTMRWISGGEYGPEGGAAATLVLIISTVVIWKSGLFKTTAEMALARRHGKPEEGKPLSILTVAEEGEKGRRGERE